MRHTLKKSEILRGRNIFQGLFTSGRRTDGKLLRCYYRTGAMQDPCGVCVTAGFAISRKIRRAVDRNRIRRLMRESYRLQKGTILDQFRNASRTAAIVFLYVPSSGKPLLPSYHDIADDMRTILAAIAERESG